MSKGYTRTQLNSIGYLPPSETPSVIIEPARVGVNSLGYQPDAFARHDEGRFTGDTVLANDGDMGLGKWSLKKPLGGKKSIFRQAARVVTAPAKLVALPVLQAVGLKTVARELNDGLIRQKDLEAAGKVVQIAGAVVGAVVAAPIIAGAVSSAAGAVGGVAAKGAALLGKAGPLAGKVLSGLKSGKPPKYQELSSEERSSVSEEEYQNLIAEQQAALAEAARQAVPAVIPSSIVSQPLTETPMTNTGIPARPLVYNPPQIAQASGNQTGYINDSPMSLRDAPISKEGSSLIPAELKPYLPYAIGGLSLLILVGIVSGGRRTVVVAAPTQTNPYRRNR